jgi:ferredoxin
VDICPEVFEMTGDVARVKYDVVPPKYEPACKEAADECPSEAISLEE